ncbi:acid-sensing ion channel 1B-like [Diadema antillarum]|uniref:acid-sensing ion channel 1B-like n=1 Tax=Diadema antillarum TaxID=105358 RepID=UPI003A865A63
MATESGMVFLSIDREGDPGNYLGSENGQKITSSRDHEVEMSDRDQPQQNAPNWLAAMYSNIPDSIGLSGVKYVCRPREKRTRRYGWLVILSCVMVAMTVHVGFRIWYFYSRPSTVDIGITYADELVFPKIIICNHNRFMRSRTEQLPAIDILLRDFAHWEKPFINATRNLTEEERQELRGMNTTELYLDLAHQANDTFLMITWAGSGLNVANVTSILTASGVCFQLNADPDPTKVLKTKVAGQTNGMRLILDTKQSEYYYGSVSRFAAGFDLYLLPQDETESNNAVVGLNINPGTLSSIGITSKRSNYLRPPYGVCGEHELKYFDTYSRTKCQLECQTDLVLEKCRCKPPFMPGQFPVCDPLTYEECGYPAIENVQRRLNECDCPVNCETLAYSYLLSSSKFPALFWADILVDKGIVKHSGQGRVDRTFLEDNVCAIDIYFTSMELTTIKQQAAYTPLALLSDIGGAMGLWLGGSLLTIYEVFDLLADSCLLYRRLG